MYTITQPEGTIIMLHFQIMDIDGNGCICLYSDYLEISDDPFTDPYTDNGVEYDGDLFHDANESPPTTKLCGNKIPDPILSSNNQIWIK